MSESYGVEILMSARDRAACAAEADEREGTAAYEQAEDLFALARVTWDRIADIDSAIQKLREQE